jgi:hypothetical protein
MAQKPDGNRPAQIESALEDVSRKLSSAKAIRKGAIAIRATGEEGSHFTLHSDEKGVTVRKGASDARPAVEIIGDARLIREVLAGEKDALAHFLAGAFRVRGDLRYFSDLALELGILKRPL